MTLLSRQDLPEDVYGSPVPTPTRTVDLPSEGTVYLIKEGRLVPKLLPLQGFAQSLPAALLLALFTAQVEARKLHTEIPAETTLNAMTVDGLVATVDVSAEFEQPAPERSLALRVAQVVYTLTGPETGITSVEFLVNGEERRVTGVSGEPLFGPIFRFDYRRFAPLAPDKGP